ncbi:MAG: hypothetical protein AAGN66_02735 [Acidobacteriota bacterium]
MEAHRKFGQIPPWALALLLVCLCPVAAGAQAVTEMTAEAEERPAVQGSVAGEEEPEGEGMSPCVPLPGEKPEVWLDRMRAAVYRSVCASAFWFDSFFGEQRFDQEVDNTFGRLVMELSHDERDGIDGRLRLKAKIALPRLENRWNAFAGRFDEEEFVTGTETTYGSVPAPFAASDQSWLLGLGYNPLRRARSRLDVDAGIKLDFPSNPFVRARYRHDVVLDETRALRLRQTVFWRRDRRFGTTSQGDLDIILSARRLLRWSASATITQESDGVDWVQRWTLYQALGDSNRRAIAYQAEILGESDRPVPVERYGLRALYRQRYLRDWLYLTARTGVSWPREELDEARRGSIEVGFGFEMLFGDHPWD